LILREQNRFAQTASRLEKFAESSQFRHTPVTKRF